MKNLKRMVALILAAALLMSSILIDVTEGFAKVKLNKSKVTIYVGKKVKLTMKGTKKKIKWSSSKKSVASVSAKGVLKGKSVGKAKITAKVGKKKCTCKVTVKSKKTIKVTNATSKPVSTTLEATATAVPTEKPTILVTPTTVPAATTVPTELVEPTLAPTEIPSEEQSTTWDCLGDSITANAYVNTHYYNYIEERNPKVVVRNYGVSGTKIAGTASSSFCNRYSSMAAADVITVFGGVNDWGQKGNGGQTPLGTSSDTSITTFYGALNTLCAGLKEKFPDSTILFATPLGNDGFVSANGMAVEKNDYGLTIESYVNAMIEVCDKYDIPVIDLYRESGFSPYDAIQNKIFFHDGLHLSNTGHLRISYLFEQAIRKYYWNKDTEKAEKVVDFFMFMGQSNMAGRGVISSKWTEKAAVITEGAGFEFRAISDPTKLYSMGEPFGVNENNSAGINEPGLKTGSMVTAFTNAYYNDTGIPIIGVSASKGGSSITQWQPNGNYLNDASARMQAAIHYLESNGYTIRHKYMMWCQGESDADHNMSAETYQGYFDTMLNQMIDYGIEKCFMVRIGCYNGSSTTTDYTTIAKAETEIAKENEYVVMVSTDFAYMKERGLMKDSYHFYQKAYNEVGMIAGQHAAYYVDTGVEPHMYDSLTGDIY